MPIKHAAFKALRQTKKRTVSNRIVKDSIKDQVKAVRKAIEAGDYQKAEEALKKAIVIIDKASQNKVLPKNAAGRKKSRLTRAVQTIKK